jgi:hypothetical protein
MEDDHQLTHFTDLVTLKRDEGHFTQVKFEISSLVADHDVILPYWWLKEHTPSNFFGGDSLTFGSAYCRQNCVRSMYLSQQDAERGEMAALRQSAPNAVFES